MIQSLNTGDPLPKTMRARVTGPGRPTSVSTHGLFDAANDAHGRSDLVARWKWQVPRSTRGGLLGRLPVQTSPKRCCVARGPDKAKTVLRHATQFSNATQHLFARCGRGSLSS